MGAKDTAEVLIDHLRDIVRSSREVSAALVREPDGELLTVPLGALLSHVAAGQGDAATPWRIGCTSPPRR